MNDPLSDDLTWIDPLADRFEAAWKKGRRPRLEDYLADLPTAKRVVLLPELIELDLYHRQRLGETPVAADYLGRFPEHGELIHAIFHDLLQKSSILFAKPSPIFASGPAAAAEDANMGLSASAGGRPGVITIPGYEIMEVVGRGGMGVVYKARHRKLDKVVAIKVIPERRLDRSGVLRRFRREVWAAARLNHPNVVLAYDAEVSDDGYFFVMEWVPGKDLGQLVQERGPLPIHEACDYVRQAALGLQHAYEQGLVHRDVKPSNLMLVGSGPWAVGGHKGSSGRQQFSSGETVPASSRPTAGGPLPTLKILDFGLARLRQDTDEATSLLTHEGDFMGTPDFMAPEQTLDPHSVNIRADLYSLGCTLYFLLTGQVPFPGGTVGSKIARHQTSEPQPVEQLRPEASPAVAAVVRKLMRKQPEERYQTPAEVAAALSSAFSASTGSSFAAGAGDRTVLEGRRAQAGSGQDTLQSAFAHLAQGGDTLAVESPYRLRRQAEERRLLLLSVAGGSLVLVAAAILLFLLLKEPGEDKPRAKEKDQSAAAVASSEKPSPKVDDAWLKRVTAMPAAKQAEAVVAKLRELNPGFDSTVAHSIDKGVVTEMQFVTDKVTDISPLRALTGLRILGCSGTQGKGQLADLSPLKDMKLRSLGCANTQVVDLTPLKGMPLAYLMIRFTRVFDLSPLQGMPLTQLDCNATRVADLSPLKGMPLKKLDCGQTPVADLSPLKGMPLGQLHCDNAPVADLTPLEGMPLTHLDCPRTRVVDLSPLRGMPLAHLNCGWTRVVDLSPLKGMPLTVLHCGGTEVADLSPLKDTKLAALELGGTKVADLRPLKGLPLGLLHFASTKVSDLSPLRGMPLTDLDCQATRVTDLKTLIGMKLTVLYCGSNSIVDLTPLKDLPLMKLHCRGIRETDLTVLKDIRLKELDCDFKPKRDTEILRSIKTLEMINSKPAKEFWEQVGTR